MRVVWLSWKDRSHPQAGGAETVSGEIMDRLARDGHEVVLLTSRYPGSSASEKKDGVKIIRAGGKYSVYYRAKQQFVKELNDWPDCVIDEMNTIPFASGFYSRKSNILLSYQLARGVWFYQMPFPISIIGYLMEPLYLRMIASKYMLVLTESESTRQDIMRYGFLPQNIHTFRVGIHPEPLAKLTPKQNLHTVLSLGAVRPMKRTLHAVKAFEIAKDTNLSLDMVIAGDISTRYGQKVLKYIRSSRHSDSITILGRITDNERLIQMRKAAIILVSSVKEGWGLIITEANSQGTPGIAYDVDGLRDSVNNGVSGIITPNGDFTAMGDAINALLGDKKKYNKIRQAAWEWSREFTFENSYRDFITLLPLSNGLKRDDIKKYDS